MDYTRRHRPKQSAGPTLRDYLFALYCPLVGVPQRPVGVLERPVYAPALEWPPTSTPTPARSSR